MTMPLQRLVLPVQDTLYPAYSLWQDDIEKLRAVWLRVLRLITAVVLPAMLGLAVVAPDFVRVVLGARWMAAVPVLQVLCYVAIVQSPAASSYKLLLAVDRTHTVFRLSVVTTVVTVSAFFIGIRWGIVGVAVCYAVATTPVQLLYLHRALSLADEDARL